jgi:hypothetical protein
MYTKIFLMVLTFWAGCSASFAGGDDEKPVGRRHEVEKPESRKQAHHDNGMEEEVQEINLMPNANIMEEEPGNPEKYLITGLIPKPKETSFEKELQDTLDLVKKDLESRAALGPRKTSEWSLTGIDVSDNTSVGSCDRKKWTVVRTEDLQGVHNNLPYHMLGNAYLAHAYCTKSEIKEINANIFCNLQKLEISSVHPDWINARNTNFISKLNLPALNEMKLNAMGLVSEQAERNLAKIRASRKVDVSVNNGFFRGQLPLLSHNFSYYVSSVLDMPKTSEYNVREYSQIFTLNCIAAKVSANNSLKSKQK